MLELLETPARQAAVTQVVEHRPWPLPDGPWVHAQTWNDLLFAHWRIPEDVLRPLVPEELELETFDGTPWLGITPFVLTGFRLRGLPPLPLVSSFPELNVRTYVAHRDKPGIWFFSLDAGSAWAVEGAKLTYKLPYRRARMSARRESGWVAYESSREGRVFSARYRGAGDLLRVERGSLEEFLAERFCLYTVDGGRVKRAEIHHAPWPLQRGEATIELNTMAPVELPEDKPHLLFSARQDAVLWPLSDA